MKTLLKSIIAGTNSGLWDHIPLSTSCSFGGSKADIKNDKHTWRNGDELTKKIIKTRRRIQSVVVEIWMYKKSNDTEFCTVWF
jgi:hypothetical protein